MATYKVPQDVEADDKLLGPLSFRQFVYLMIDFGLIMLTFGLIKIFPLLGIIPVPAILFLGVLALPIKKDQPMETYIAALISYYTKPNKRYWIPGQSESTIIITAPKVIEAPRARDFSGDEASHRLSFLAELVDSEGHAIKNASTTMKDDFYAEAYNTTDMFDQQNSYSYSMNKAIYEQEQERRNAVIDSMRDAIEASEFNYDNAASRPMVQLPSQRTIQPRDGFTGQGNDSSTSDAIPGFESPTVVQPIFSTPAAQDLPPNPVAPPLPTASPTIKPSADIQAESDRIKRENESEVYVSLH